MNNSDISAAKLFDIKAKQKLNSEEKNSLEREPRRYYR